MEKKLLIQLVVIFLIAQFLGLMVGLELIKQDTTVTIVSDNPEDISNSIGLFVYILVFTAILLVLLKYFKKWFLILKALELIVVFGTSSLVFSVFLPEWIALILAVAIVLLRVVYRKNIWSKNISSVLATAGAGALIGIALGIIPVIVFIVLLSIYDFIAVFKTKHMVTLAKGITQKNLSFTFALPTKEHTFELGTGDLVIPLTFAVSVLGVTSQHFLFPYNLIAPLLILLGSLIGLIFTMDYSSKNVGTPLPALPLQTIIMVVMLGISFLFGFFR